MWDVTAEVCVIPNILNSKLFFMWIKNHWQWCKCSYFHQQRFCYLLGHLFHLLGFHDSGVFADCRHSAKNVAKGNSTNWVDSGAQAQHMQGNYNKREMCMQKEECDVSVAPENSIWLWHFRRINSGGHIHKCKTTFHSILKGEQNTRNHCILSWKHCCINGALV